MMLAWEPCYPAWLTVPGSMAVVKRAAAEAQGLGCGLHLQGRIHNS